VLRTQVLAQSEERVLQCLVQNRSNPGPGDRTGSGEASASADVG
jgi:hypothetical protein